MNHSTHLSPGIWSAVLRSVSRCVLVLAILPLPVFSGDAGSSPAASSTSPRMPAKTPDPVERAQALLEAAQVRHDMARDRHERALALVRQGYLSTQALTQSEAEWDLARAELQQARTRLETARRQARTGEGAYTHPKNARP